ncbi:MAG: hypothetical protein JXA42_06655 [Anaerolineales bacterium]|nr:hypothetical protein [Anaerolineales bacterium]
MADAGPDVYQIQIREKLDRRWSDWFEGLEIAYHQDDRDQYITILTGPIIDQAALYGILQKIHNLNLVLISVQQME